MENGSGHTFRKFLGKQAGRLALLASLVAVGWLWVCCIATWIPCDSHPYISLITFTFPVALVVSMMLTLIVLLVRPRWVWIPLVGILLCWGYIMDYCPLGWGGEVRPEGLKVVSWNTRYLGGDANRDEAEDYLKNLDADIICLQETITSSDKFSDFVSEMKRLGYEHHCDKGKALFTRLHILETDTLVYDTRSNGSRWYLLARDGDTVLVVNNHLESNHMSVDVKEKYGEALDRPDYQHVKRSGRSMLPLMVQSARYRGGQARVVRDFVKENRDRHVIVCGDFNDTPVSYAYQTLARRMKNAFRESGSGLGVSYNEKGFWVRIDHLFFSSEGRSHHTFIDRSIGVSDHFPIVSWVDFKQNQQ